MRIKEIHNVHSSKTIETFVTFMKAILGPKLGDRIYVHKTLDTVYEYVPKYIFPEEFGGKDKPLSQLRGRIDTFSYYILSISFLR